MDKVNLSLLATFSEIYRTRNVSRAAENLGMSQPGLSAALGRLRRHFGDRLFVRTSTGMEPTAHAQQLIHLVDPALEQMRRALGYQAAFDPKTATRHFTLCTTDVCQLLMLPRWLERRRSEAPNVSLEIVRISEASSRALESGQIDLAVGFLLETGTGLHEKAMDTQDFTCVARVDHPRVRQTLSLAQFQAEPTVVIDCVGSGSQYAEMILRQRKIDRNVVIKVPDFLGVQSMIESSDMIATVPTSIAVAFAKHGRLQLLAPPLEIPPYMPKAYWHQRFHLDPANQWLRQVIVDLWLSINGEYQRC